MSVICILVFHVFFYVQLVVVRAVAKLDINKCKVGVQVLTGRQQASCHI